MDDCCRHLPSGPEQKQPKGCHSCNQRGKPVAHETVEALIKPEFRDTVNGRAYAFCETPTCPVVYYTADGSQVLKTKLRVRVGLKETQDPIPVCYCFNVTERMIHEEIERTGKSTAFAAPFLVAVVTSATQNQRVGFAVILVFLVLGFVGLFWVKEERAELAPQS